MYNVDVRTTEQLTGEVAERSLHSDLPEPPEQPEPPQRAAIRLLQGYIWHPQDSDTELEHYLPNDIELPQPPLEQQLGDSADIAEAHVLWDQITPPFAFFENGEPTSSQEFYQFTVLRIYKQRPSHKLLGSDALSASQQLGPLLEGTPSGVGWHLWEDLREL